MFPLSPEKENINDIIVTLHQNINDILYYITSYASIRISAC